MVTSRGWWDLADANQFYPEDLPDDWRLSYFANCFRAALLPAEIWTQAAPAAVTQWHDDVPGGFRFVAEQPPTQWSHSAQPMAPAALEQLLVGKLAAWLEPIERDAISADAEADGRLRYRPLQSERQLGPEPHCYGLLAPAELHRDLRSAKRWLQTMSALHGRAPSLVVLARPLSSDLEAWQELLDLLGLS